MLRVKCHQVQNHGFLQKYGDTLPLTLAPYLGFLGENEEEVDMYEISGSSVRVIAPVWSSFLFSD